MAVLWKGIYKLSAISIKTSMTFFTEIEEIILKFIWKYKRVQIAKTIMSKKSKVEGIRIPDFKLHYRAIVTKKKTMVPGQNRHIEQWNRPRNKPTQVWTSVS
jgi:hypothetical protein